MRKDLLEALSGLTMPIWSEDRPSMGRDVFHFNSPAAAYRAAALGHIPSIAVGRKRLGLCAPVRKLLGLDQEAA